MAVLSQIARPKCALKPQFEKALDALGNNGSFLLIDDRQAESVDQEFVIGHDALGSSVKLTPLVGGQTAAKGFTDRCRTLAPATSGIAVVRAGSIPSDCLLHRPRIAPALARMIGLRYTAYEGQGCNRHSQRGF